MNLSRSDRFQTKMFMNGWVTVHFGHISAINWGREALMSGTSLDRLDGRLPPNLTAILSSVQKKSNIEYKSKKIYLVERFLYFLSRNRKKFTS